MTRDPAIETAARSLYDSRLPYHNFGHIQLTLDAADRLLKLCHSRGVKIRDEVVYLALVFHDAGYHEDAQAKGHASKEAYSAHLARQTLSARGVDESTLSAVETCILGTQKNARTPTVESKVVREADLAQLAAPFEVFKRNSLRLHDEQELMRGKKVPWSEWVVAAEEEIETFLGGLELVEPTGDGSRTKAFIEVTRTNLTQLFNDPGPPEA